MTEPTDLIDRIRHLNLAMVAAHTGRHHPDWDDARMKRALTGYRQFLALRGLYTPETNVRHVPHVDVDEVWHSHILHTVDYVAMCGDLFGAYFHHTPSAGGKPTEQDRQDYAETCARLAHHFGPAWDPRTWQDRKAA